MLGQLGGVLGPRPQGVHVGQGQLPHSVAHKVAALADGVQAGHLQRGRLHEEAAEWSAATALKVKPQEAGWALGHGNWQGCLHSDAGKRLALLPEEVTVHQSLNARTVQAMAFLVTLMKCIMQQLACHCGRARARMTPGRPAPEPTSMSFSKGFPALAACCAIGD